MSTDQQFSPEEFAEINDYLEGSMSDGQKKDFENRLATDTNLRSKFNEVQLLSLGIQETQVETLMQQFHEKTKTNSPAKIIRFSAWKKLAAAAIIISAVAAALWFLYNPTTKTDELYATYFKPDPGLPGNMSIAENYEFEKAMVDYKTGNYPLAIESWEKLTRQYPDSDTLQYFIGVARLANNEPEQAVAKLDQVINSGKEFFLDDAYWYKALALLKLKRNQEALLTLGKTKRPQAAELIKQLK